MFSFCYVSFMLHTNQTRTSRAAQLAEAEREELVENVLLGETQAGLARQCSGRGIGGEKNGENAKDKGLFSRKYMVMVT